MINLLNVKPKEIHLLLDVPREDLRTLVNVLANSEFKYDSSDPEQKRIAEELTENVFPNLQAILEAADGAT